MTEWADIKWADPKIGPHGMRVFAADWLKKNPVPYSDVYEFGVCCGHSMVAIQRLWKEADLPMRRIFGYDSFEGLPTETAEPLYDPQWHAGNFSAVKEIGCLTVDEAMDFVTARLDPAIPSLLIPGYWDVTLRDESWRPDDMQTASYIDIDCDIYSSALLALDFVFSNQLAGKGTLIGYHDWGATPLWKGGESRAHREMCIKHKIAMTMVHCDGPNAVFVRHA